MFISWAHASFMLFIKPVLSLGDTITDVLLKFISSLSSDAAGADMTVLVALIDRMSSIRNFCENKNPYLTVSCLPSIMYLMPDNSDMTKPRMAMFMHKAMTENPANSRGAIDIDAAPSMTNISQVSTFDLYVLLISLLLFSYQMMIVSCANIRKITIRSKFFIY